MNTLIGLAICFGLTYFLCASKATEEFRATPKGEKLNNAYLTGAGVGGILSLLLVGPFLGFFIINCVVGLLIGWGVQTIKDQQAKQNKGE